MRKLGLLAAAGALAAGVPAAAQTSLAAVASFDHQATGVAVTADGRRFVNFPRWTEDAPVSVAEVARDGSLRAYPDARWNSWRNVRANELPVSDHFVCVQSIVPDGQGIRGMTQQSETVEERERHAVRASHAKSSALVTGTLEIAAGLPCAAQAHRELAKAYLERLTALPSEHEERV